jgi:deoxycytidine triphosphate deaminase
MLSDRGIRHYLDKGLLKVDPEYHIGPASIDLHIGSRLYRSNPQAHLRYQKKFDKLAKKLAKENFLDFIKKLEEPSQSFNQYVSQFGIPVSDSDGYWILEPDRIYYAQTKETITTQKYVGLKIATRSSSARIGLNVQDSEEELDKHDEFKGNPFLVIRTCGTTVELPRNYSICQMVVEPLMGYLFKKGIEEAIKNGDITISGNPVISFDSLILTFHHKLLGYNGKTLNPSRDNSGCFDEIDISNGCILKPGQFYLGSTKETIGIGKNLVGILDECFGPLCKDKKILSKLIGPDCIPLGRPYLFSTSYVHLNAPYHWPGSKHQMTLEIFPSEPVFVKAGQPACRLLIQQLYPECESPYSSKYNGQEGPTISRVK